MESSLIVPLNYGVNGKDMKLHFADQFLVNTFKKHCEVSEIWFLHLEHFTLTLCTVEIILFMTVY